MSSDYQREEDADRKEALEGRLRGLAAENWSLQTEREQLRAEVKTSIRELIDSKGRLWDEVVDRLITALRSKQSQGGTNEP